MGITTSPSKTSENKINANKSENEINGNKEWKKRNELGKLDRELKWKENSERPTIAILPYEVSLLPQNLPQNCWVPSFTLSDHRPLCAVFKFFINKNETERK